MSRPEFQKTVDVTIANGQSLSGSSGDLRGYRVGALVADAAWDTNAISFAASYDGTNFFPVFDDTPTEYSIAGAVAGRWYGLEIKSTLPIRYIKVRSGLVAAPVNQVGATVITLVLVPA